MHPPRAIKPATRPVIHNSGAERITPREPVHTEGRIKHLVLERTRRARQLFPPRLSPLKHDGLDTVPPQGRVTDKQLAAEEGKGGPSQDAPPCCGFLLRTCREAWGQGVMTRGRGTKPRALCPRRPRLHPERLQGFNRLAGRVEYHRLTAGDRGLEESPCLYLHARDVVGFRETFRFDASEQSHRVNGSGVQTLF